MREKEREGETVCVERERVQEKERESMCVYVCMFEIEKKKCVCVCVCEPKRAMIPLLLLTCYSAEHTTVVGVCVCAHTHAPLRAVRSFFSPSVPRRSCERYV